MHRSFITALCSRHQVAQGPRRQEHDEDSLSTVGIPGNWVQFAE